MFGKPFVEEKGDYIVVTARGRMTGGADDAIPIDDYRNAIADHLEACKGAGKKPRVIFDLGRVTYLNSTAIGILVNGHVTINRRGGKFILTGINKNINNIFVISRLALIFEIADSLEQAEEKMRG